MRWNLTQAVEGKPEIDIREDDEEPVAGYAFLRTLAGQVDEGPIWMDSGSGPGWTRRVPEPEE